MKKCVLILVGYSFVLHSKLLIITTAFNRPEFIELQYTSFSRYLQDDYEYVVFNDAPDTYTKKEIDTLCSRLSIRSIHVPQQARLKPVNAPQTIASWRHGQALDFAIHSYVKDFSGIVMIIDSDMFLIKNFSVHEFLGTYDIAGIKQIRGCTYIWPGLIFMRMDALQDKEKLSFCPCFCGDSWTDTGGALGNYLVEHPTMRVRFFPQLYRLMLDKQGLFYVWDSLLIPKQRYVRCSYCMYSNKQCKHTVRIAQELNFGCRLLNFFTTHTVPPSIEFVLNDTFVHYAASCNWDKRDESFHRKKTALFFKLFTYMMA